MSKTDRSTISLCAVAKTRTKTGYSWSLRETRPNPKTAIIIIEDIYTNEVKVDTRTNKPLNSQFRFCRLCIVSIKTDYRHVIEVMNINFNQTKWTFDILYFNCSNTRRAVQWVRLPSFVLRWSEYKVTPFRKCHSCYHCCTFPRILLANFDSNRRPYNII